MTAPTPPARTPGADGAAARPVPATGATPATPRAAAPRSTSRPWPRALAAAGHDVTDPVRRPRARPTTRSSTASASSRHGSKLGVYPQAFLRQLRRRRRAGSTSSSTSRTASRSSRPGPGARPVVVLVHHVHREQWPVVYGPVRSRIGWWIESRLAPRVYRGSAYVAVSDATRHGARRAGRARRATSTVVHNGCERPCSTPPPADHPGSWCSAGSCPTSASSTSLAAAAELRADHPGLRVEVVGDGWWSPHLAEEAERLGVERPRRLHRLRRRAGQARGALRAPGCSPLPSLKEGWGLRGHGGRRLRRPGVGVRRGRRRRRVRASTA